MSIALFKVNNVVLKNLNLTCLRSLNSLTASITKTKRAIYPRMYPTMLVNPDGSTIKIRYHEPRYIITLPLDMSTLTEEERNARLERRKPKKKVVIEEHIKDNYNANKYLKHLKNAPKR